jgi:ribosomal protein S18 acetylase RimI-like enzyme
MGTDLVSIRKAEPKDIPLIKRGLIDSWVGHAKHEPGLLDEERMRESDVEGYYGKALTNPECIVLVAEQKDEFAGFIRANIETIPSFFKHNRILFLDDVYVPPKFRRAGIARALVTEVEARARKLGIRRLQGRVYSYNIAAQTMLKSLGYHSPHATWDKFIGPDE